MARSYRRDPQQWRVYDAENVALGHGHDYPDTVTVDLPELADVRAYVLKVQTDKWFVRHFGRCRFTVKDGRGMSRTTGYAHGWTITIPRRSRCRWIVLHELAHCLQTGSVQAHGPEYVRTYLRLVRHFLGREAWRALYRECKARKVKMQVRRRRPLAPEQRARLLERLATARAAKATMTIGAA
jgi:putative metallohydrolase (TIGR04338 family)